MKKQKRRQPILIENIKIIDTAYKGRSIAKHNGRAIFVQDGVPGDICDITVFRKKKKFWEARIEKVHAYSNKRVEPACEHFGVCGGCKWQNMSYESQLDFKQNEVLNNLKRIGGIRLPKHSKIIGSKNEYFYRNKMEFTFSNKRWLTLKEIQSEAKIDNREALGFHVPGVFDKVINLNKCHLQKNPTNAIRLSVKEFADKNKMTYFDIRKQNGLLRNLIIRTTASNDLMVLVQFFEKNKKHIKLMMEHIKNSFPSDITMPKWKKSISSSSIVSNIQQKMNELQKKNKWRMH